MNLLQLLLGTMTSNSSVNSVSEQTGISSEMVKKLLILALPLLIRYMTQNASNQTGAQSLLNALGQHSSNKSMSSMINEADNEDGKKIIGHILGKDQGSVVSSLASQTGLQDDQVTSVLGQIAPGLLSGLSAATTQPKQDEQSGLLNMFGGQATSQSASLDLLGTLLGSGKPSQRTVDGSDLLNLLGQFMK